MRILNSGIRNDAIIFRSKSATTSQVTTSSLTKTSHSRLSHNSEGEIEELLDEHARSLDEMLIHSEIENNANSKDDRVA